jgi:hypothetical protein
MATISDTMMDHSSAADSFSHAGADTRQWISYGIVQQDIQGGDHSVRFNDDSGSPLPQGVLVDVKLMPSGIIVPCRVGGGVAGSGEAEYSPFGPGDEVLVAVPEGNERAGCVILSRLTNSSDTFPTTVASNDVTQNNVSFKRTLTPFIHEVGGSYTIHTSTTGAALTIGIQAPSQLMGGVMLNDGNSNVLTMSPTGVVLASGEGAQLTLGATSSLMTPGALTILTAGSAGLNTPAASVAVHAIGVEQVCMLIEGFMAAWATSFSLLFLTAPPAGGPVPLAPLALTLTPLTLPALMATGITAGSKLALTAEKPAIATALTSTPPNAVAPNVGCLGFTYR